MKGRENISMSIYHIAFIFLWVSTLQLGVHGQFRSPRITEHPKDVLVKKNEPTTLNCKAEGKPEPNIEWYRDGEHLNSSPTNDGRRIFLPGGDLFFLSVSDGKKESDSGTYWCIARNQVGSVRSRNATLQVGVIRDEFRVLPQSSKVLVGETAIFRCQPPRGTPEPQVVWHKNGQNVETRMSSGSGRISNDMGNLVIKDVRPSDAGRYQCNAINIAGTRSSPEVILSVNQKPGFTQEPEDVTILIGSTAEFTCDVRGMPLPEVSWYRQDANMPMGRFESIDGSLRIKDVRPEDEGTYFCQASNDLGSIRASARLAVLSKPKFISRPRDVRIGLNGVAKFECSASGSPPPEIRWRKEGTTSYLGVPDDPGSSPRVQVLSPEGSLRITGVKREDSGIYVCTALSPAGSKDATARLAVTSQDDHQPPPIISILPTNQTLPIKSMATIPCQVDGTVSLKWLKDGMELDVQAANGRITVSPNGTLHISDLRSSDSGQYTCVASSTSGETSGTGYLWVESPTNPNIAFHRTNLALLPVPPSAPTLVNETGTNFATISWTLVANKVSVPTRTSPLLGFSIEAFSPDLHSGWVTLGHRIYGGTRPGEVVTHTVSGLRADTSYVFIVRAENIEGFSVPSKPSAAIKTKTRQGSGGNGGRGIQVDEDVDEEEARNQLSGSDIELISAEPASSTSIRISWKVSKSSIKYIDGYYIRYRDYGEGKLAFNILTVVAQKHDFETYSHVIQNLKKYGHYEVFVSPFYKSVEGQPSNTRRVWTAQDRPSASPQSLVAKMINTTAASVRWSPPPVHQHNGIIQGYRVEVRGNESRIHAEMDFAANISTIVLNNLTLGKIYWVRVAAFTSVGPGPFSEPVEVSMDLVFLDPRSDHDGVTAETGGGGGTAAQLVKEPWFIILMGVLIFVILALLLITLYSRRKSHGKKDHISSVAVAPHADSQFVSGKQSLWIDQRWRPTDCASDKDSSRSEAKLLPPPNMPNHHLLMSTGELSETTDYAEVDPQSLTTFYNNATNGKGFQMHPQFLHQMQQQMQQGQGPDLTPYATTTLIQQRRPNYDPLPSQPVKNMLSERDSDQFSSGRSKLSMGSNNFSKFKSAHGSPSPSPSAGMKMMPMTNPRMGGGCYPSPGPNRSHMGPLEGPPHHPYLHNSHITANENLYHIGEIFSPNKSASVTNGLCSEAVYQSGDPEDEINNPNSNYFHNPYHSQHAHYSHHLQQQQQQPLIDREIQSSLPSLASDSTSCNLYAEADDVMIPSANNYFNSSSGNNSGSSNVCSSNNGNPGGGNGGRGANKNSRSNSPAYSSDSFNSGKSGSKRLYNGGKGGAGNKKKFDNSSCKSLERRHLAPLLPGSSRTDDSSYSKPAYPELNGFQKLSRFPRPAAVSQSGLDTETGCYPDWQLQECSSSTARLPKSLKESNA